MNADPGVFVVIQPGPAQGLVLEAETQGFHQVEFGAGIGAETDDVAGIGGDFRLEQNDGEHLFSGLKRGTV